jgi:hypothetical protein
VAYFQKRNIHPIHDFVFDLSRIVFREKKDSETGWIDTIPLSSCNPAIDWSRSICVKSKFLQPILNFDIPGNLETYELLLNIMKKLFALVCLVAILGLTSCEVLYEMDDYQPTQAQPYYSQPYYSQPDYYYEDQGC